MPQILPVGSYCSLIEGFEQSHSDVRVTKVDVYKSPGLAAKLGIDSVPSIVYLDDGKIQRVITEKINEEILRTLAN